MAGQIDVVVVGAGPVGLLLAVELVLGGARVLVLERLTAPNTGIKALTVGPLGAEALQRRGMAAAVAGAEERRFAALGQAGADLRDRMTSFRGHFAFLPIPSEARPDAGRRMRMLDQQGLEAVLSERARALGVDVRRGCAVAGFAQHADGVEVDWTTPDGVDHVRCSFLVGCDGGRSPVRKRADFAFQGTPPTLTMYQAIADLDHPERLPLGWHRTERGVFAHGPFPRRLFLLDFAGPPADREAPVSREEVEAVLRRISGAELRVTGVEQANRWTDNTRLADSYRMGRVLIAGDAAHVHAPFGGQGLSLGLGDAANLGWKLAAVVRGDMPDALLDSYTAERRPVADAVLANTLAQVAIMRPDPQSGAMREVMARLMGVADASRVIDGMMSGLSTRYDLGSERDEVGRLLGDAPVGRDGTSLYDLMGDGRGVLLDASGGDVSERVATVTDRVRCVAVDADRSTLIRPDACVAWAGTAADTAGLADALHRWFAS